MLLFLLAAVVITGIVMTVTRDGRKWPGILAGLVLLAAIWALADPYANIPVVSQVICSLKGDAWYGGSVLQQAGCYRPLQVPALTGRPRQVTRRGRLLVLRD